MSLTSGEQQALLWPIQAKDKVQRWTPLGDPAIEQYYHTAMEGGRYLERNIADANHWLLQKKQLITNQIQTYTHMNSLAVDGQLGHSPRVPKFIADSISLIKTAQQFQREIVSLVAAIQQNITMLLAIEQSLTMMVQTALNSIANLLNNICNWGIPALPSIPNILGDMIWNWNGFTFSPLALFAVLKSSVKFNFNFSLADCSLGPTSPTYLFVDNPLTTESSGGLVYGSANYNPPFGGAQTSATQDLNDPTFISAMQANTIDPVYNPAFNPNTEMFGAVPDPHQIISNWQMTPTVYTNNIVSVCPELRPNTVFIGDPDYANPNLTVRQPSLSKALAHFITLDNIVATNFDPFIVSAWLIYLNLARQGRGGAWLPNFAAVYQQYLTPSLNGLRITPVPWNDVLPGSNVLWMASWNATVQYVANDVVTFNGVNYLATASNLNAEPNTNPTMWEMAPANLVYNDAPVIPLIAVLQGLATGQRNYLLWQLSYVEAAILGYTRSRAWDSYQDASYLTGPTGSDLDYQPTAITASNTNLVLGENTAAFPVTITFPSVMKTSIDAVVAMATANIAAAMTYLSPRLGNRFTFNQFAVATQVDRFSQFWRDFATNLTSFLAQDPYLIQFTITYPDLLDGAIDPLASALNLAAYQNLQSDVSTRSRSWAPGTPLPNIPIQPMTGFSSSTIGNTGWIDNQTFSAATFLSRPDVQSQPIGVQIAMLRTNLSYASVNAWSSAVQTEIQNQIANANTLLQQSTQELGFHVSGYTTTTPVAAILKSGAITNIAVASNTITVAMNPMPAAFSSAARVVLYGLTGATFLNGVPLRVSSATTTSFVAAPVTPPIPDYTSAFDTGVALISTWAESVTEVVFDPLQPPTDFDYTANYINPTTFMIQATGTYLGFAIINWTITGMDTVTVMITQNGTPIVVNTQSATSSGALATSLSFSGVFNQDDVVQVVAFTQSTTQEVVPGTPAGSTEFGMIQVEL